MNPSVVEKARHLMLKQTEKNGAPAWALTEIAIKKGKQLAKKYGADQNIVLTALYLAHAVFSKKVRGSVQKNHERLSARFAAQHLKKWGVSEREMGLVTNAILAHHDKVPGISLEAEVMKNAECFKFVTLSGAIILVHHMGERKMPLGKAADYAKIKAKQKFGYMTFKDEKAEARKSLKEIEKVMSLLQS